MFPQCRSSPPVGLKEALLLQVFALHLAHQATTMHWLRSASRPTPQMGWRIYLQLVTCIEVANRWRALS